MAGQSSPSFSSGFFLGDDGRIRPLWRALWFVFFSFLGFWMIGLWAGNPVAWQEKKLQVTAAYLVLNLVLLLASWILLRTLDGRGFRTLGLWFYSGWGRELALGAAIGSGMVVVLVGTMTGAHLLRYQGANGGGARAALWLAELAVVLFLAAAAEEIAFRGYGFQRMVDSIGPFWATVAFSIIFGSVHWLNPSATALSTVSTVLVGVLLAIAYLRTRALWLPIGLHWAWNFFEGPIFSLPVSGIWFPGELLRATVSGAGWLSGGPYGPEGSALAIGAYVLAIVWLWRTRRISVSSGMQEALK